MVVGAVHGVLIIVLARCLDLSLKSFVCRWGRS